MRQCYSVDAFAESAGGGVMFWRELEIIVVFLAMGCFAFCQYERADFLMLFLIYNKLIKEEK